MIQPHNHNGIDSPKLRSYNVIPTYRMTATELTAYLARPAIEGEEFNVSMTELIIVNIYI